MKEKSRSFVTSAKPEHGVPQLPAEEVRSRLPAISGKGSRPASTTVHART